MMDILFEQLKTIKNLCEIAKILIEQKHTDLLPTILETILEQAQAVVDENCIEDNVLLYGNDDGY